jgi:CelD/BcsL family acetyltransferase involved in cellulose biosynthesis
MAIDVVLDNMPAKSQLADWWRRLEGQSNATFFTSWSWIGPWLDILPSHLQPRLLIAREGEEIVGLGLVVRGRSQLLRVLPVSCWRLHATGHVEFDSLTIEYNGFLACEDKALAVKGAMLDHLLSKTGVSRFEIHKAEARFAELASSSRQRGLRVNAAALTSYTVDLAQVRQTPEGYLSLLSANTRSQVRRSLNGYRKLGEVTVEQAQSVQQAKAFLQALRDLHAQKWEDRGESSAFANSRVAQDFHDRLIDQAFERGEVQLLRFMVGDTDLGYLYNFVHRGRVVFYQSGFRLGLQDKQDRPGLVCHALAIEHNTRQGALLYDFTAGDYRYKGSLATGREPQGSYVFQRDGLLPRLEDALRHGKRWLQDVRNRGSVAAMSLVGLLGSSELWELCMDSTCSMTAMGWG